MEYKSTDNKPDTEAEYDRNPSAEEPTSRTDRMEITQISYQISTVSIGKSFSVLNTTRGIAKMITKRNGNCMIPEETGWNRYIPLSVRGTNRSYRAEIDPNSLMCIYHSYKGIYVIAALVNCTEFIEYPLLDHYCFEPEPVEIIDEWSENAYCFINQDLEVVVPFRDMDDPISISEKYPDVTFEEMVWEDPWLPSHDTSDVCSQLEIPEYKGESDFPIDTILHDPELSICDESRIYIPDTEYSEETQQAAVDKTIPLKKIRPRQT